VLDAEALALIQRASRYLHCRRIIHPHLDAVVPIEFSAEHLAGAVPSARFHVLPSTPSIGAWLDAR